jgi:hypothetical protein
LTLRKFSKVDLYMLQEGEGVGEEDGCQSQAVGEEVGRDDFRKMALESMR